MQLKSLISENNIKFGTSGMRGKVSDWKNEVIYFSVISFLKTHLSTYPNISFRKVAIAGDLRPSTDHFLEVVATAIKDLGYEVDYCGKISTPSLMLYSVKNCIPSIMVTGSHIPDDRNGIKFHKYNGEILKSDEEVILKEEIDNTKEIEVKTKLSDLNVNILPENEYIERYIDFFEKDSLKGLNIGLYGHSAVGRDIVYKIFIALGAKVTKLGFSEVFIPVDTDAVRDEDKVLAKEWSEKYKFDAIISTDGDSDRPLISDEKGIWVRGDILGAIVSKHIGVNSIATPITSNSSVDFMGFKKLVKTKIGSPYVISSLIDLVNEGLNPGGYELNGGYLLASDIVLKDRNLTKLLTRDSVLPMISLITYSKELNLPLSVLVKNFEKRFTQSLKIPNFETTKSKIILDNFYTDGKIDTSKVREFFKQILDLEILDINTLDGVRVTYSNKEVLHIRPSGNAPELRCYSESDSQVKADKLALALQSLFN